MDEVVQYIIDQVWLHEIEFFPEFEEELLRAGFIIVPVEDPTNLRFGVDE